MGRGTKHKGELAKQSELWAEDELSKKSLKLQIRDFKSLRRPLWTQNKARLIQEYLRLFVMITKHGTYVDGFAAPQESSHEDMWAAKLVLEMEPSWLRDFWLCDISNSGIERLKKLQAKHGSNKKRIRVMEGDFNETVHKILMSRKITEKTATFALLDQRTFECHWDTVRALSEYKSSHKIELFYFFPTGWVDRSIASARTPQKLDEIERWWGRDDWRDLRKIGGTERAVLVAKRFENELNYGRALPFAIHDQVRGGRAMYHMVHATDHPEAPQLMIRAYRKVSGRTERETGETQINFDEFWGD